ncbi:formate dehydrogenase accessory sulfurtransferase FdhD [Microbacterium aquimaris]|uniref:formate dehydrogenase accessory sulfurtransferase FdhD n=1 Tax=Microbacterium aquimaris TaxID=459816 RepID=UPI002AD4798A|nr:formate dehydrogenase accessory sulfurtransferase FdhD [Microbacterium aquimaris]MDZ8276882.1 formate dehydrogenase accessory sulfurtransferase FdhD [Microbacterium aquimaris]
MARSTARRRIVRVRTAADGSRTVSRREDVLAAEEPLEIRIDGSSWAVTMRTPGDDFDLVAGFLVGEGVIVSPDQLRTLRYCAGRDEEGAQTYNVIDAHLGPGAVPPSEAAARHSTTTSACGICGTQSIDAVAKAARLPIGQVAPLIDADVVAALPDALRDAQPVFDATGGVHAAGLFTAGGDLVCVREDVGRHNAVDKVIGWALREGRLPVTDLVLQVSGRASFELVQKARLAGIPMLTAVGAPSTLAAQLADDSGVTLVGFSRGGSFAVHTHPERVTGL